MPDYLDLLRAKAFQSMPGGEYNRYRFAQEERFDAPALFYEVALLQARPWAYLRDEVYPSFCRHLKYHAIDPEQPEGAVVVVFHGDQCHLIHGRDFLSVFREVERLSASAFHFRVLQWLAAG
jgi:hypothetical protein